MEVKQEEWKKEEQNAFFEKKMKEMEERDKKIESTSEEYKLIGKQTYPCEVIGVLQEIQEIDGTSDITWIMAKAFLYGLSAGVRRERSKKAKVITANLRN